MFWAYAGGEHRANADLTTDVRIHANGGDGIICQYTM